MPAKSSLRDKNKKLTDFFTQGPFALATSSTSASTTAPTARRPATRASTAALDCESSVNASAPYQTRSISTTATRKRARSPDSNNPSKSPFPPPKLKSPKKPVKVFQPEPSVKRPTAVVYVTSPFRKTQAQTPIPMQVDGDALDTSPSNSSKQVVCSSQSDEAELVLPLPEPKEFGKVVEGIQSWRQKASKLSSSPPEHEDVMEVDTPPSSPIRGSPIPSARSASPHFGAPVRPAVTPRDSTGFQTPVVASACLPSPPDIDDLLPLLPTPEPIDSEAKTTKLIAEIKAKAFAATQSSDDERRLEFRELEDSDDDDLIDDLPLIGNAKKRSTPSAAPRTTNDLFSSPLSSVPSTFNGRTAGWRSHSSPDSLSPPLRPTRTSARSRKATVGFRLPAPIAGSSTSTGETKSRSLPANRKKSINPLHALLREKELEDKRGTSSAAVRRAEEAAKQSSREASVGSDDEFDAMSQPRLTDEQAAWEAVHEFHMPTSPADLSDLEDIAIGDRESKMLGGVAGAAINKILVGDKSSKGKAKAPNANQKMASGVPLWIQFSDVDMEVDPPSIPPLSGHHILACMDHYFRSRDDASVNLILRTGVLAAVPRDVFMTNIPCLLSMALFASSQTADAICIALRDLWESNPQNVQLPFAAILHVLARLGASPVALKDLGFITEHVQQNYVSRETQLETAKRLLTIVKTAGFAGAISSDDVANVLLILVIIGLDPATLSELRTQLNISIDVLCNHGATDSLLDDIHERIFNFAKQLAPVNKFQLVSFFASGSGRTRCIARHLAYCLLVSAPNTAHDQAPPLEPLVLLLSPDAGSRELFDVTNESMDYEELGHYVDILSVALVNIAPYVEAERAITKSAGSPSVQGSPGKSKKPPVSPLELLRRVLEVLQSKIVDTRAAHLDRSRTKAALQRLTMRICYDRMVLMGTRTRRESTLRAYFSPQR